MSAYGPLRHSQHCLECSLFTQQRTKTRTLRQPGRTVAKTIEHHIDISWNEAWTGTTQIRDVKKEGNKLIYTTRPAPFAGDGKMSVVTLVWEKVK